MKTQKILFSFYLLVISISVQAQMPVLKVQQADNQLQKQSVKLKKINIDVQIIGNIATTVMTMTFYNISNKILEGELTFPMPEGVSISRYALDINGKMREAVPVEKEKATTVFESIERQRVDPGLLEKVEGNNFRTRIYPLPAKGSRTIIVGYEEELGFTGADVLRYHLPLDYEKTIEEFVLKTTVFESVLKPVLAEQPDGSFNFKANGNTYVGEIKKTNYAPKNGLSINLPKRIGLPEVQMQKASSGYYFLVNAFPKNQSRARQWSDQIGLIWDCSLSGLQRNVKKELLLLDMIIKQKQNLTVRLGLLNNRFTNGGTFKISGGNWTSLKKKLESIVYDGGTDFSTIHQNDLQMNEYLFFTDGLSTFGNSTIAINKPVHTINSTLRADYSALKSIGLQTGAEFVTLNSVSLEQAFKQLNQQNLHFLGIKNGSDVKQTYPSMHVNVNGHFSLAGIVDGQNTKFTLQFGFGNTVVSEMPIRLNGAEHSLTNVNVSRIWAQKKIAEMDIQYDDHKEDISALSKQFGIVTRNTSLIVLENLEDYLRYDIEPPKELRAEYDAIKKRRRAAILERKTDLINAAVDMTKDLKIWWNTDFAARPKKTKKYPTVSNESLADMPPPVARHDNERVNAQNNNIAVLDEAAPPADRRMYSRRSPRMGKNKSRSTAEGNQDLLQPSISIPEFKSDKHYMKNLRGNPAHAYQNYLKMKPAYISTPMFYFDVANWFYQQKDSARALTILSNIADLDLENADLYKLLAYKLKQTGNYTKELFITKKVLDWRPMEAQSYRDYALALADVGQYQKALDYLYEVLTQSYNSQTADRDEGIEEIIVSEINNLITRYPAKLNIRNIDKRIILPLPVDIRVVINWNKNDTDIDLWLTDPTGEKGNYSHPRTQIGGRISNDFTAGYGPEQFMVKKAIKGKYKIEVNYYGDRQINISGPTMVTAEIYTKYATGKQERKVIVIPMQARNENGSLIGEFSFD